MKSTEIIAELLRRTPGVSTEALARELGTAPNTIRRLKWRQLHTLHGFAHILTAFGFRLAVIPEDAELPEGSIIVDPISTSAPTTKSGNF